MGQTLSSPVTETYSHSGADDRYIYGISEMQGWRISMEDAHTTILNLDGDSADKNAFFAVFDGHGGSRVAKFSGDNVHKRLVSEETYREKKYDTALKKAFLGTDEDIRADPAFFHDPSGCTAVAALLTSDRRIYVANAGDSRSIISVRGEAKPLSYDHKPQNETEASRITAAGGYIEYGRVNGNLSLSRALGDFEFKKNYSLTPERQIITADPDIIEHKVTDEDEFLVLACDGIWDCLSSQQVVDCVRRLVYDGKELTEICNALMELCLAPDANSGGGIGCDNMTVMVIALLNGRTKEEWYAWIKDRVERKYGYDTPEQLPQIYAPSRLQAAQARNSQPNQTPDLGLRMPAIARALASGGFLGAGPTLIFDREDSDEDSDEEEGGDSSAFYNSLRAPAPRDVTKSLKAQLDELRDGMEDADEDDRDLGASQLDADGDAEMSEPDGGGAEGTTPRNHGSLENKNLRQGEGPPPPSASTYKAHKQPQLEPRPPSGDASSGSFKVEGLMDTSESPLKVD